MKLVLVVVDKVLQTLESVQFQGNLKVSLLLKMLFETPNQQLGKT